MWFLKPPAVFLLNTVVYRRMAAFHLTAVYQRMAAFHLTAVYQRIAVRYLMPVYCQPTPAS